jgi:hypothetical protein
LDFNGAGIIPVSDKLPRKHKKLENITKYVVRGLFMLHVASFSVLRNDRCVAAENDLLVTEIRRIEKAIQVSVLRIELFY